MNKKLQKLIKIICLTVLFGINQNADAQCIATGNNPSGTITVSPYIQTLISTNMYPGNYAICNIGTTGEYTVNTSFGTFITVTDNSNTVLASGNNPIVVNITSSGLYRVHIHSSTFCSSSGGDRIVAISPRNRAFNFDGVNDYINVGSSITSSISGSNKVTAEAWVNPSTNTGVGMILGNHGTSGGTAQFFLRRNGSQFDFAVNTTGGYSSVVGGTVNLNTWQHVAGVWNGSVVTLYVNGVSVGTTAAVFSAFATTSSQVWLGYNNFSEGFTGSVDEARVWSRALCQGEIQNNMGGSIPTTGNGLVGNYHFDQGVAAGVNTTITTLIDASGNANTGTVTNAALTGGTSNWVVSTSFIDGYQAAPFTFPVISVAGANSTCSGSSVTFTASGNVTNYTWLSGPTTSTYAVTPSVTTSYSVTGTNSLGCLSNMVVKTLTVNASPTITVNNATICSGNSAVITPTAAGITAFNITGSNFTVSPTANTSYSVTGTGTNGCVSSNTAVSTVSVKTTPTITVNNATICSGNSAVITPTAADISVFNITGSNFTVSPTANTSYSVTGTGTNGCVSSNTAVSTVSVKTTPTITVNNATICSGNSAVITPTSAGISAFNITGSNFTVSPTANTSYSVTGTGTNGCVSSNTAVSTVSVKTTPTITVNSATICSGTSAIITPTASGVTAFSITGSNFTVSPTSNTSYSVTGTGTNGCVSSNTAVSSVSVNPSPTISVTNGTICSGNSFTIVPNGAATYTIEGGNAVVNPIINSTYTVIGSSSVGCLSQNTATANLTVNTTPTVAANSGSICLGSSFTIVPTGASTYTIEGGNNIVSPSANTSYTIIGSSVEGCLSQNTATSNVTVENTPTVSVNSGSICSGMSFTIVPSGASTYTIEGGNNVVSPNSNSTYTVIGASSAGCVSQNTATSNLTVTASPTITVNSGSICVGESFTIVPSGALSYTVEGGITVVSPTVNSTYSVIGTNADGCVSQNAASANLTILDCTGLDKNSVSFEGLKVYPNPSNGIFIIEVYESANLAIQNSVGQLVYNEKLVEGKSQIDLSHYSNGIYFITITNASHKANYKIIKQ